MDWHCLVPTPFPSSEKSWIRAEGNHQNATYFRFNILIKQMRFTERQLPDCRFLGIDDVRVALLRIRHGLM